MFDRNLTWGNLPGINSGELIDFAFDRLERIKTPRHNAIKR